MVVRRDIASQKISLKKKVNLFHQPIVSQSRASQSVSFQAVSQSIIKHATLGFRPCCFCNLQIGLLSHVSVQDGLKYMKIDKGQTIMRINISLSHYDLLAYKSHAQSKLFPSNDRTLLDSKAFIWGMIIPY